MQTNTKSDAVKFMTRGQLVIPAWLRRQFHIEKGTRAIVTATPEGILLRPVTDATVDLGFGLLKPAKRAKSFDDDWNEHKQGERKLEDAREP